MLCVAGGRRATASAPSVELSSGGAGQQHNGQIRTGGSSGPAGQPAGLVHVSLRPVTCWISFPLLNRLQAFASPLMLAQAQAQQVQAAVKSAAAERGGRCVAVHGIWCLAQLLHLAGLCLGRCRPRPSQRPLTVG